MWAAGSPEQDELANRGEPGAREKLDRALVAGLILEAVLDQADLPDCHEKRRRLVINRIQDYLVKHLAGRVSLDRFRALAQNLESWFDYYYPLVAPGGRPGAAETSSTAYFARETQAGYRLHDEENTLPNQKNAADSPAHHHHACLDQLLDSWLESAKTDIPHRSHRKLTPGKLRYFLRQSAGRWFRLRDFERYVQMDRKTAWDYLQQFLQSGLLCHNRKNSAAVRYCLAPSFLKVEADALRLVLSLCLRSYPEILIEKVSDFLIATGGDPFPVPEWEQELDDSESGTLLNELLEYDIIFWQRLPTGSRFLKLHHRWLQQGNPTECSKLTYTGASGSVADIYFSDDTFSN